MLPKRPRSRQLSTRQLYFVAQSELPLAVDMRIKMILPALTEAVSPFFRPIKYSLFPPLGLATLAAYLDPEDEIDWEDEHVERIDIDDTPELVVIQVYITSARRAYELADHYRERGRMFVSGGCTSPLSTMKLQRMPTRSFSGRERTAGNSF